MLQLSYDYAACVRSSEKANWKIDDVMPEGTRLDFAKPFLPERLAPTAGLSILDAKEKLVLNHITGNAYLNLFGFVEEYILTMAVKHALDSMEFSPAELSGRKVKQLVQMPFMFSVTPRPPSR